MRERWAATHQAVEEDEVDVLIVVPGQQLLRLVNPPNIRRLLKKKHV